MALYSIVALPQPAAASSALAKQEHLFAALGAVGPLIVAFSGGTDSAYLAWAAHHVLGEAALAVTAISPSYSAYDRDQAEACVRAAGLRHEFISTAEFENPLYVANRADRCYHCKNELFDRLEALARSREIRSIAYGVNADDPRDFRPGHRAAREHHVLAPLLEAGLSKVEIRLLAERAGLPVWDRPASACLSSRVPYGTPVTPELLARIERAEAVLRELGFRQLRVRAHGDLARIELAPEEIAGAAAPRIAPQIVARFHAIGFTFIALDLEGYRQGSLNSLLPVK